MRYTFKVLMAGLLSLVLAMGLVACGGGGSSSDGGGGGNTAPVANAGADQNVAMGLLVTLDGSGNSDADGASHIVGPSPRSQREAVQRFRTPLPPSPRSLRTWMVIMC